MEPVVEQLVFLNPLAAGSAGDQCRIDPVAAQRIDDVGGHHLRNLQFDFGIVPHEIGNKLMQQVRCDGRNDAEPQPTGSFAFEFRDRFADMIVSPEGFPDFGKHHLARLGRNDRFLAAIEQHHAQFFLQRLDLHAQRRLGHETVFRCQRETAAIGYRQQVFELDDSLSYLHARKYKKNRYFAIIIRPSV